MLQLIESYEKRPYLSHVCATKSQCATGQSQHMQLYRASLLHTRATKLRDKIAGVTSVLMLKVQLHLSAVFIQIYDDDMKEKAISK